ncbi:MAG TPA: PEGA domain-containing protein [Blastocatellia bacterium]|nr:PEGA domain-containing protein [Blastocatellia bacterium]
MILTILTVAAVYLVAKRPSMVDQLVILTVPSGADIKLDGKDYGHSPVKLERLAVGTYTISITKDGYEPDERAISVLDSGPLEFKLKPVAPSEALDLPAEEKIRRYQQLAEEAFARGSYGLIYEGSALNWVVLIEYEEPKSAFAVEMRERIQKTAHQSAQAAVSRGDLAQAKEIYSFLLERFPFDEEARVAAAKLESQLAARRGKIGELIRKADEAFQAGRLVDPMNASAYYYSKQVLAIDKENEKARQIRSEIKDRLAAAGEQAIARDPDSAIRQLDQVAGLFPEDKRLRARVRDLQAARTVEQEKAADPEMHRVRGLEEYRNENFADAIQDLQFAVMNGRGTNEVLFALARSYQRVGQLDLAEGYFLKLPPTAGDPYRSAIAARGDMALQRGDSAKAVERWKEARQLGGSTMYSVAILDDKIERVERPMREKAAEPQPLTIQVRHLHGGLLGGSCGGALTVSSTGVTYEGKEHQYSYNVAGVGVRISNDEMTIQFGRDSQKFKVARTDAERFREALARYQNR